jgi:hydrogenase nickel insertion protein HypA
MHELLIASSVMESVLQFAARNEIKKVLEVRLSVGELMAVEWEQLRFCYGAITRETPMEDSSLEIESVEAAVSCPSCSFGAGQNIGMIPWFAPIRRYNVLRRKSGGAWERMRD